MTFRPAISPRIRAAVLSAYEAGEKTDVIEMEHGLSRGHARKIAMRAGLPPRPIYSRKPNALDRTELRSSA